MFKQNDSSMENVDLCSHYIWVALAKNLLLMKLWMFQWCIAYHMTLQFQWTLSLSWLRYDLRSVYISVLFGRFWFNFDLRLHYQECYDRQPEIQYRVNTKHEPLSLLHRGYRPCQLFACVFWSQFCEKAFCPRWSVQVNVI